MGLFRSRTAHWLVASGRGGAALALGVLGLACSAGGGDPVGSARGAMRGGDDGPPDPGPTSGCVFALEGDYTPTEGPTPFPHQVYVSTYDLAESDPSPFGQWRASQWAQIVSQYQADQCPSPPGSAVVCAWRAVGQWHCTFRLEAPGPPECDSQNPCPGAREQCIQGQCVEVCDNACGGHCGAITACGETIDCGGRDQGSCDTRTTTCRPDCSPDVEASCNDGVCNPQTLRCEPGCQSITDCPIDKACDIDVHRCIDACSPKDDPPGPDYECVMGVWRFRCNAENPCPSIQQECRDGYCYTVRCGEGHTCPEGRFCDSDNECIPNCSGHAPCPDHQSCNPATNQCEPFDPCVGVHCDSGQVCHDGNCVTQTCAGCTFPSQCIEGVCVPPPDPCQGVVCPLGGACTNGVCPGGCTWDLDCSLGDVCEAGQCVPSGGQTCVLDGVCEADESCSCDAACCGSGGGGDPCTYGGSGGISYQQCYACGGTVHFNEEQELCEMSSF